MSVIDVIIAVLVPFLYIVCLAGLFIYLFHKRYNFQVMLPLALISATLFIFIFTAFLHNLTIGFWITVAAAAAFVVLLILDKDRKAVIREKLLTPGFAIFCLLYVFLYVLDWFKIVPLLSDTSMHWAPHVWTMWLRNDFYTSPNTSIVIHGDYPPMLQLFELIWSKAAGAYREGLLFVAVQIISFAMFLPVFGKLAWQKTRKLRDWLFVLLLAIVVVIIPMAFFVSDFFSSLEVDTALAFVFFYGLYLAVTESKKFTLSGLTKLSLLVAFLSLTKQIAVLLAGLVVLIYLLNLWISYRHELQLKKVSTYMGDWKAHWKVWLIILLAVIFPLFCMKLWSAQIVGYISPDSGVAIFHLNPTSVAQIPGIVARDSGTAAQQNFARSFIRHIFMDPGGLLLNNIGAISYMQLALLFLGIMIFVGYTYKDKFNRHRLAIVTTVVTLGWFVYCFVIYATFLFGGMNSTELNNIDTPNRYLRTYLLTMLLVLVAIGVTKAIDSYTAKKQSRSVLYLVGALIVLLGIFVNKDTVGALGVQTLNSYRAELSSYNMAATKADLNEIEKLSDGTFSNPTKVLVTASTDNERHYIQYNALPNRIALLLFEKTTTQNSVCNKLRNSSYFMVSYNYTDTADWGEVENCLGTRVNFSLNEIYKIQVSGDNKVYLRTVQ